MPPPVHGASMMGLFTKNNSQVKKYFESKFINISSSKYLKNIGIFSLSKLMTTLKIVFKSTITIIFWKPDLIYFTPAPGKIALLKDGLICMIINIFKIKKVSVLHARGFSNHKNRFFLFWINQIFKNSKTVLLGKSLKYDIEKFNSDIEIIPNGIEERKKSSIKSKNKILNILFVSNLIKEKGVYILIDSLKKLIDEDFNFKCRIVGEEGDLSLNEVKSYIKKLNLSKSVFLLGPKYGNEKDAIFEKSDLFVLPTFYSNECMPLVILEAMKYEMPVISTNIGAIPDLIINNKTGKIINNLNISTLSNSIKYFLLNKNKLSSYGKAGEKRFKNFYTKDEYNKNIFVLLKKSLNLH